MVAGLSECSADVDPVLIRELARRLFDSLRIRNLLRCVQYIARILCGSLKRQCSIFLYCSGDLCDLGFCRLSGLLDCFNPFIALFCQTR